MNLRGISALYRRTCGRNMPFARPCATPKRAPTACASAWLTPTNAFENARPAIVAALAMSVRARRSSPSATARGSAPKIRFIACRQNASVNGDAKIDTYASSAWVSASTPVSAVISGGSVSVSRGSTIATSGTSE